jgi:ferritin-like metal-binding protein YciE
MQRKTIDDLFIHALSDIYSAEKQLTKALPKMARAASHPLLQQAFNKHLEETHGQVERIDKMVALGDLKLKRIKCAAMEGLVEEGAEVIDEIQKGPVLDAALIGAAQKVEHYEIASYGTLCELAKQLGMKEVAKLLLETLKEEKDTDVKLTQLAGAGINAEALKTSNVRTAEAVA